MNGFIAHGYGGKVERAGAQAPECYHDGAEYDGDGAEIRGS